MAPGHQTASSRVPQAPRWCSDIFLLLLHRQHDAYAARLRHTHVHPPALLPFFNCQTLAGLAWITRAGLDHSGTAAALRSCSENRQAQQERKTPLLHQIHQHRKAHAWTSYTRTLSRARARSRAQTILWALATHTHPRGTLNTNARTGTRECPAVNLSSDEPSGQRDDPTQCVLCVCLSGV